MGEFTFTVHKKCPICGEMTRVVKVKSRLVTVSTDEDLCVHYRDINPYYYKIWFCEHCSFAAEEKVFLGAISAKHKAKVKEFTQRRKLSLEFTEERGRPEAVASFKLAGVIAEMMDASLNRLAGLTLQEAWIYREAENKEKEIELLGKAADLYERSLATEVYPQGSMSDNFCMYLVGAIRYRMGDLEKAAQYLSRIIGDQTIRKGDPRLYKKARDLWQDIRNVQTASGKGENK